jgi:hypothetical protein
LDVITSSSEKMRGRKERREREIEEREDNARRD